MKKILLIDLYSSSKKQKLFIFELATKLSEFFSRFKLAGIIFLIKFVTITWIFEELKSSKSCICEGCWCNYTYCGDYSHYFRDFLILFKISRMVFVCTNSKNELFLLWNMEFSLPWQRPWYYCIDENWSFWHHFFYLKFGP